jgi:hypothetical protein
MNLLFDPLRAFRQDLLPVFAFAVCMLWGAVVIVAGLRLLAPHISDGAEILSLVLGGWFVPLLAVSGLLFAAATLLSARGSLLVATVILTLGAGASIWAVWRSPPAVRRDSLAALLTLAAMFLGSVWLRLAFVADIPLPLYFDSVQHYRVIQTLLDSFAGRISPTALSSVVYGYYHVGFHLVLAAVAWISQARVATLMLVSGQIMLAAAPVSLFVIPRRETGSAAAGVLAVCLGALGWYMPAYAVNWGKYPALFSLGAVLFTLNVLYLASRADCPRSSIRSLVILGCVGAGAALIVHTRSIFVLAIFVLAWILSKRWADRSAPQRWLLLATAIVLLAVEAVLVTFTAALKPLFDPYLGSGILVTVLVGLLSVGAFRKYPRLAFGALLSVALLLAGLLVPSPNPAFGNLLDRPLVEMLLFIPLSLIGGAGFAALSQSFGRRADLASRAGVAALSIMVALHAFQNYNFYPSPCCSLVARDDMVALDWIGLSLPRDARILVPSAPVSFFPPPYPPQYAETDAGAWILPLTGRAVSDLPYWSDFRDPGVLEAICQSGATDVYVGRGRQSFSELHLRAQPEWYRPSLVLPGVAVYHVKGCVHR